MIKRFIGIAVVSSLLLGACKNDSPKKSQKSPVIETIDGVEVTTEEFDYVYKKNNSKNKDAYSDTSIKEY
mgnify:CR=1 FL=1